MINPRYVSETGMIYITKEDGNDLCLITGGLYDDIVSGKYGEVAPYVAPAGENTELIKINDIEKQIQKMLDAQARSMGYDSIYTAVTYADEPAVARFQQEGQALRAWRSQVWAAAYAMLADWQAGNITEPSADEVLALMPGYPS